MFGLIIWIAIIYLLYRWAKSPTPDKSNKPQSDYEINNALEQRNVQWVQFISSYSAIAKSASSKALLQKMLTDIEKQGLASQSSGVRTETGSTVVSIEANDMNKSFQELSTPVASTITTKEKHEIKIDNASLLLYFGAFLFVASVGLFIGFAGVNGVIRTLAVAFLAFSFYGAGIWLYGNKKALKPAGQAFAGIGIAVVPLIGVAAYNYVLPGSPELVWFMTSILCCVLYSHAVYVLRSPLLNYVFMFTVLSLFESAVAVVDAPIYYFGWVMALVGLGMLTASRLYSGWAELQESSRASAQLFVPLSLFVSLAVVGSQGVGQLGVSLLLAGMFYAMESYFSEGYERTVNALVAHISIVSSVASLIYAVDPKIITVAIGLIAINVLHSAILLAQKSKSDMQNNFASVAIGTLVFAFLFSLQSNYAILTVLISSVVLGMIVWNKLVRIDGYALAIINWTVIPLFVGRFILDAKLDFYVIAAISLVFWVVQIIAFLVLVKKSENNLNLETGRYLLLLSALFIFIVGALSGAVYALIVGVVIAIISFILSEKDSGESWEVASGLFVSMPIFISSERPGVFLSSILIALLFNVGLALKYRSEYNRWISSILWLVVPLGLGAGALGENWTEAMYAWSYMVVMACLILSRAIARGSVLVSSKIPMAAYAKSASMSYVYGYVVAATIGVLVSLNSSESQFHTTLIFAVLSAVTLMLSVKIEARPELKALLPWFFQALLISLLRPEVSSELMYVYLLLSSSIASIYYFIEKSVPIKSDTVYARELSLYSAIGTSLIAPLSVFVVGESIMPMALGLIVFGALVYDYFSDGDQDNKEIGLSVMVLGAMWMLYILGLRQLQAYTHIVAVMFAAFAYWRYELGDKERSNVYLQAMLVVATIPLALQALYGQAGDLYGWWLLLEQILFMLLGMMINNKFVTNWGLYVAVASVLYQLRDLGFAALAFLALFIIGIAVYQLQKYNQDPKSK